MMGKIKVAVLLEVNLQSMKSQEFLPKRLSRISIPKNMKYQQ